MGVGNGSPNGGPGDNVLRIGRRESQKNGEMAQFEAQVMRSQMSKPKTHNSKTRNGGAAPGKPGLGGSGETNISAATNK